MKKAFGIVLLALLLIGIVLSPAMMPAASAASQLDINNAIEKGLAYLNSTQNLDGSWGPGYDSVSTTAMAVLAFENAPNNHFGWNLTDPYHTTVQKGLDYLFEQANVQILNDQPAGNPDTNGNGFGLDFALYQYDCYQTPMVLMAIVASQNKTQVATTGPANVTGRSYFDIATDIVDWIAWAQSDINTGSYRGGWRYSPNEGDSDNSVSQWPVLGLMAAHLWGIDAPAWVKSELNYWIAADEDLTGNPTTNSNYGSFGYMPGTLLGGILETSTGILELTYIGATSDNASIIAAEGYINRMWNYYDAYWNVNIGNLYDMYGLMKAMRETAPSPIQFIANYDGTPGVEWYNGTGEYADALITNQSSGGSWVNWKNWAEDLPSPDLSTAFGVLILEFVPVRVNYMLTVHVVDASNNATIANAAVDVNGQGSYTGTTNSSGLVVFPSVLAGFNRISASSTGYLPGSANIDLINDTTVTIYLERNVTGLHEVIVTNITAPAWMYQDMRVIPHDCANISVTVENVGDFPEDAWVTLYYNITANLVIGSYPIHLEIGQNYTLTFVWNTVGVPCGTYTLTAVATIPTGSDTFTDGTITVRLLGDVNGDGRVNLRDLALVARAFGSTPTSPNWNPAADINGDGTVDMRDITLVARHFGQHYP